MTSKAKRFTFILMAIGVIALIGRFMTDHSEHHQESWANLLVNGFFFFAIALGALFFYALQYAAEVAWSVQVKRIFEAMFSYVKIGAVVIFVIVLAGWFHVHHLYHFMDPTVTDPTHTNFDKLIADKMPYLNMGFYMGRTIVYLAVFIIFARLFRKWSLLEDENGSRELHFKVFRRSAVFLVFFAVFSSTLSWDWLMSIDTHWFSTLYGWYVFSGMWVSAMIFSTILVLYLKKHGYLPKVNESHIHDLGKWMFAISMLWSYLWVSQFLLIWYANIPEEVTYYITRMEHFRLPFLLTFFVNFAIPFYFLMSRDAKRNYTLLTMVGCIIFFFHWMDIYLLVIPGTMYDHSHLSFADIGMFLGFLGLFIFVVLSALSKAPLTPKNHPLMGESENHHV